MRTIKLSNITSVCVSIVKDPLCHFAVIGLLVFVISGKPALTNPEHTIEITPDFIKQLESQFHHTYLRPPTAQERQQLINDAVMDLALYYEGLQQDLEKADQVVKRRVIQKMNFIIEGMANPGQPTLPELMAFMNANPAPFYLPAQYDFEHYFFSGHDQAATTRARNALTQLTSNTTSSNTAPIQSDPFIRGTHINGSDATRINRMFGNAFAQQLTDQAPHQWFGPIASTYGLHLVKINAIADARLPAFHQVKDKVYAAWKIAETKRNMAAIKQKILTKYVVKIPETNLNNLSAQHVALQ